MAQITFRGSTVSPTGSPIGEGRFKRDLDRGGWLVRFDTGPDANTTWQVNGKAQEDGSFDVIDYRYEATATEWVALVKP